MSIAMSSTKQIVSDIVDNKIAAALQQNTTQQIVPSTQTTNINQQQELLKRSTEQSFTEALTKSSTIGKFSIIAEEGSDAVIDIIENDAELAECGRCKVIERRTSTSLAVSTDEATAICIQEQLRARGSEDKLHEICC